MLQYLKTYKQNKYIYFAIFFVFFYSICFLTDNNCNKLASYNTGLSSVLNKYTTDTSSGIVLEVEAVAIEERPELYFYNCVNAVYSPLKNIISIQLAPTENNLNKLTDSLISYLINRLTFYL